MRQRRRLQHPAPLVLGNPSVSGVEPGEGQEAGAPGSISQSWATAFGKGKSN
jgi:hypothetical protein